VRRLIKNSPADDRGRQAFCGEAAAQFYKSSGRVAPASLPCSALSTFAKSGKGSRRLERLFTTAALLAEGEREIDENSHLA
jgi:hypothetical protein